MSSWGSFPEGIPFVCLVCFVVISSESVRLSDQERDLDAGAMYAFD